MPALLRLSISGASVEQAANRTKSNPEYSSCQNRPNHEPVNQLRRYGTLACCDRRADCVRKHEHQETRQPIGNGLRRSSSNHKAIAVAIAVATHQS